MNIEYVLTMSVNPETESITDSLSVQSACDQYVMENREDADYE